MVTEDNISTALTKIHSYTSGSKFNLEARNKPLTKSLNEAYSNYKSELINCKKLLESDNSGEKVDKIVNQGLIALKRLDKIAVYLSTNYFTTKMEPLSKELTRLIDCMNKGDYNAIISAYDVQFSDSDWEEAKKRLEANSEITFLGSRDGLMYSYTVNEGVLLRRDKELGSGNFGRARAGKKQTGNKDLVVKRQKNINSQPEWLNRVREEAEINFDLGVATSRLIERKNNLGNVYKVYQEMKNLGSPLIDVIKDQSLSCDKRLDYAIDLLLNVSDLHSGKAANSKKQYTHLDIKPDNVLVDESGKLHLIDFGTTKSDNLKIRHCAKTGTMFYLPISFNPSQGAIKQLENISGNWNTLVVNTPSYFVDDYIATLRTIYHALFANSGINELTNRCIIRKGYIDSLPNYISEILDTSNIRAWINKDLTLTGIASVLILYRSNNNCTEQEVKALLKNPSSQECLIKKYQNNSELKNKNILSNPINVEFDFKKIDIINKLNSYEEKIKKNKSNNTIDFEHGFKGLFKKSRGKGREVNYSLALKLIEELSQESSDAADVMSKVSKYKREIQKEKGTYRLSFGPTTSNELNTIINDTRPLKK